MRYRFLTDLLLMLPALDLRSCGRGDIRNRGGTLVCRGRNNGAWWSHNG